jgi:hypothetical protein
MCCVNLDILCFLIVAISSSVYTFTNCSSTDFRRERERESVFGFFHPLPPLFFAVVEDLNKRRQPLPALDAVYFIQPSQESVRKFMQDMSGKSALYKKAYVFFSSPISRDLLQAIKSDQSVLSRIAALREMNLEYLTVDTQGFITDNDEALELLFGGSNEGTRKFDKCIETIATRLSTVFASMKVKQINDCVPQFSILFLKKDVNQDLC